MSERNDCIVGELEMKERQKNEYDMKKENFDAERRKREGIVIHPRNEK